MRASIAPDARNTPMATSMAMRYGMMRTAVANPSFAPSMNASYTFTFFLTPASMNMMMMRKSRMLAADVLTRLIVVLSMLPNPHIIAAAAAHIPPSMSTMVRFMRLMRWYMDVAMMPAIVEQNVASRSGTNTSVGCSAPICARYTMMETGMMVSPEVLSTRNIIIGSVAVSLRGLSVWSCSMAFSPSGVAALSSPSMLAAMFMKMDPVAGCPLGMPGNSRVNTGESTRARAFTTPPRSPIFIMPSHSDSTPVSPIDISNAVFAVSKVEFIIAGKTSVSPINSSRTTATAKAMTKNAIQM